MFVTPRATLSSAGLKLTITSIVAASMVLNTIVSTEVPPTTQED